MRLLFKIQGNRLGGDLVSSKAAISQLRYLISAIEILKHRPRCFLTSSSGGVMIAKEALADGRSRYKVYPVTGFNADNFFVFNFLSEAFDMMRKCGWTITGLH